MKTRAEAAAVGEQMLARLGKGWELRIDQNMGWYVHAYRGPLSVTAYVHKNGTTYSSFMSNEHKSGCSEPYWNDQYSGKTYTDPVECVRAQVAFAKEFVDMVTETLTEAQAIGADFMCPCCKRNL